MNQQSVLRRFTVIPAVLWMVLIFLFSHQEGSDSGHLTKKLLISLQTYGLDLQAWFGEHASTVLRKSAHFGEYFILGMFLLMAFYGEKRRFVYAAIIGSFYGVSDEIHQYFIPGRVMLLGDMLIDCIGVLTAIFTVLLVRFVLARFVGNR